ncbi:MAG: insulinase family protein, partial [Prevotella sp.]|nr:insulinase family protein [Prevotella sp.]
FVGNFDEDKLRPLLEQYIASLPATGKKSDKYDEIPRYIGEVKNVFTQKMENPQNMIVQNWRSAKSKNSLQNQVVVDIAARLLNMKYDRSIRETLSAAYSASAESGVDENPDKSVYYNINGVAMLNPAKSAKAIPYFMTGLKETVEKPDPADLQKVKAVMLKNADVAVKTNGYWINILNGYVDDGQDFYTGYKDAVRNTTPQMISDFLKNVILKSGNHAEVLMNAIKG